MNAKSSVLLVFGFASLSCFFSQAAQAQTVNVTIQDNSGAVCALPTAAKTVLLPSTPPAPCAAYSGFSIAGIGAGARVTDGGANDATEDVLLLRGTVITATAANVTGKITFWATDFTSGPTGPSNYETTAKGTLTRSNGTRAAKDSWIKISGYWQQLNWDEMGTQQSHYVSSELPVSYGTINKATAELYSPSVTNRGLKGYVEFFLKNSGDKLTFSDGTTDGVRVRYATPGGEGSCPPGLTCNEDPELCRAGPPACPEGSQCLSCVKESERTWFSKWLCSMGIRCPACIIPDLETTGEVKFEKTIKK